MEEIVRSFTQMNFSQKITIFILTAALCALFLIIGFLIAKIKDRKLIAKQRNDAVLRSRAIIGGQVAEQIAPFLPNFPCNPGDARFIGKPVDFVAFCGMSEGKNVDEVLLIEVKTGNSTLSEREKEIKKAVENGKVRYIEYRI